MQWASAASSAVYSPQSLQDGEQSRSSAVVYTRPVVKVLSCAVRSLVPLDTLRALLVCNQLLHTLRFAGILNGGLRALAFFGHCRHTNVNRSNKNARCEAVATCLFMHCVLQRASSLPLLQHSSTDWDTLTTSLRHRLCGTLGRLLSPSSPCSSHN